MANAYTQRALALIRRDDDNAADAALAEALPHIKVRMQVAAFDSLLARGHVPTLAGLIRRWGHDQGDSYRFVAARFDRLAPALRSLIDSTDPTDCETAIRAIVTSNNHTLADLLADALRSANIKTTQLAADGLETLTNSLISLTPRTSETASSATRNASERAIVEALGSALQRWDRHRQRAVLRAVMRMGDRMEPALRRAVDRSRSTLARDFGDELTKHDDPSIAGLAMRALAIPQLRTDAARFISQTRNAATVLAYFNNARLLTDRTIERGFAQVRDPLWLGDVVDILLDVNEHKLDGAIRLLSALRCSPARKGQLFQELIGSGDQAICRAAVQSLIRDPSTTATETLMVAAMRSSGAGSALAMREWRRRRHLEYEVTTRSCPATGAGDFHLPQEPSFDLLWQDWMGSHTGSNESSSGARTIRTHENPAFMRAIRAKLASSDPLERVGALGLSQDLKLIEGVEDAVVRLTRDHEPAIREHAVSAAASLNSPVARRVIVQALSDPNDRVQAAAIEALDRLDATDVTRPITLKLRSENARVRANAIRSLLRRENIEAAESLLDMLEHDAPAQRLSALWVVDRCKLRSQLHRMRELSQKDPDRRVRTRAREIADGLERQDAPAAVPILQRTQSGNSGDLLSPAFPSKSVTRATAAFAGQLRDPIIGNTAKAETTP